MTQLHEEIFQKSVNIVKNNLKLKKGTAYRKSIFHKNSKSAAALLLYRI